MLNMKPVRDDIVRKFLMEDLQIPDYKANVCVAFARKYRTCQNAGFQRGF